MRYVILLYCDPEGRGYTVDVPTLPGCVTQGASIEEAIDHARDAIAVYLDGETSASLTAAGVHPGVIVTDVDVQASPELEMFLSGSGRTVGHARPAGSTAQKGRR